MVRKEEQRIISSNIITRVKGMKIRGIYMVDVAGSHTSEASGQLTQYYRADDKAVADYSIKPGATIHLVLALRGGSSS